MKNIRLILLLTVPIMLVGIGNGYAQTSSSVIITVSNNMRKIDLQVIDNDNNVSHQEYKMSSETPVQLYLKQEMDKWIKEGYSISESYGYVLSTPSGSLASHDRYETVILTKKE